MNWKKIEHEESFGYKFLLWLKSESLERAWARKVWKLLIFPCPSTIACTSRKCLSQPQQSMRMLSLYSRWHNHIFFRVAFAHGKGHPCFGKCSVKSNKFFEFFCHSPLPFSILLCIERGNIHACVLWWLYIHKIWYLLWNVCSFTLISLHPFDSKPEKNFLLKDDR